MPGQHKKLQVFHVNVLKEWIDRPASSVQFWAHTVAEEEEPQKHLNVFPSASEKQTISEQLYLQWDLSHLTQNSRNSLWSSCLWSSSVWSQVSPISLSTKYGSVVPTNNPSGTPPPESQPSWCLHWSRGWKTCLPWGSLSHLELSGVVEWWWFCAWKMPSILQHLISVKGINRCHWWSLWKINNVQAYWTLLFQKNAFWTAGSSSYVSEAGGQSPEKSWWLCYGTHWWHCGVQWELGGSYSTPLWCLSTDP